MPFRLRGLSKGHQVVFVLGDGEHSVGSESRCTVVLQDPTVSRHHADILVRNGLVHIQDCGSRNGTWIGTRRIKRCSVLPGTTVVFGKQPLLLEQLEEGDADLALSLDSGKHEIMNAGSRVSGSTIGLQPMELFVAESLNPLLQEVLKGKDPNHLAVKGAGALFEKLPVIAVEVISEQEPQGVLFSARRSELGTDSSARFERCSAGLRLSVELPTQGVATALQPLFESVVTMIQMTAGDPKPGIERDSGLPPPFPEPVTVVPAMRRIYEQAARIAPSQIGVLICGESGTGKEVLARYVHEASDLDPSKLVTLNCAALPDDLLESELFGIERGVATGVEARAGKFELADQGTIFLDEIADMSQKTQAKILRVLQEQEVYRLGGSCPRKARCRVIAATNKDIDALRANGDFREDLYYRVASWVVELPPLRHRRGDIANLASHFLLKQARQRGIRVRGITRAALRALENYYWPGNIRQLAHEMARDVLFLADGDALDSGRLSAEVTTGVDQHKEFPSLLEEKLRQTERREILAAFQRCGGIATAVAEELGISRSTLYRRMRVLDIGDGGD